jgi:hypothetical protein
MMQEELKQPGLPVTPPSFVFSGRVLAGKSVFLYI